MKLSYRLKTVASFVTKGSIVADIGTDHGYIPIYLVEEGISPRAFAMDVRTGPLERAELHIREHGLEEKIEIRLSDGLEQLNPGEADCVVIAGMGGELMIHILEQGRKLWTNVREWILSPHSEIEKMRYFLWQNGFQVVEEAMVLDEGKYYTVLKAIKENLENSGKESGEPWAGELRYGKLLIERKDPVLLSYLEQEKGKLEQVLENLRGSGADSERIRDRIGQVEQELKLMEDIYEKMQ